MVKPEPQAAQIISKCGRYLTSRSEGTRQPKRTFLSDQPGVNEALIAHDQSVKNGLAAWS
jgi:hypothetical protein